MKCKVAPSRMCCDFFRLNEQLVALNPDTHPDSVREVLSDLDGLLVMTVYPGYAGQKMTPHALEKLSCVRAWLDENGCTDAAIEVMATSAL